MAGIPEAWWIALAVSWGAAMGSFACVVVERGWAGVNGRSRCTCGKPLPWYVNVPVLAWPLLRGRARCCSAAIPAWYWLAEVATAALWAACAWALGPAGMLAALAVTLAGAGLARRWRDRGDAALEDER